MTGWTPEQIRPPGPALDLETCQYSLDDVTRSHDCYRNLLFDMTEFSQPTLVAHTDSQVVIKQLDRGELSRRTTHLRVLPSTGLKDRVAEGHIELLHVDGKKNPSDMCTTPLPHEDFARHANSLLKDKSTEFGEWQSCMVEC